MIGARSESFQTGRVVGAGSLVCRGCGYRVMLEALDAVPECPACGGTAFRRASLFERPEGEGDQPTLDQPIVAPRPGEPHWLRAVRPDVPAGGQVLAFEEAEDVTVTPLTEGWLRIGRSVAADIRLDDPTVSRRHALIVKTGEGLVRVLDDRSLNGVFVNGNRVEWSALRDGDELAIGRYSLYLLDATGQTG
jgi:predicted RNA-binding Zn-ribbon protein involved in translation (DUF1610 family)